MSFLVNQETHLITSVTSLEYLLCLSSTFYVLQHSQGQGSSVWGEVLGAESWRLRGGSDDSPMFS